MEKISDIISSFVYYIILLPKRLFENKLDTYIMHRLDTKPKIISFLILITTLILVIPVSIVYRDIGVEKLLLYGLSYLSVMFLLLIISDGIYKALAKERNLANWRALTLVEFKKQEKLHLLCDNLVSKRVFEKNSDSLQLIFNNKQPKSKVNIIFKGGSGKVSYHAVFFLFSFLIKEDIQSLEKEHVFDILKFIQKNFSKDGSEIKYRLIEQSYNDWLKEKYSITNENIFLKKFL